MFTTRQWTIGGVVAGIIMLGTLAGAFLKVDEALAKLHDWKPAWEPWVRTYATSKDEAAQERARLEKIIGEATLKLSFLSKRIAATELKDLETRALDLDASLARWQVRLKSDMAKTSTEYRESLEANVASNKKLIEENNNEIVRLRLESGK